jgi:NLI interacting factor-like phosphatase
MKHVFLIDLDGTIIGDIGPQVVMWELSKASRKPNLIKFDMKGLYDKLLYGHIVRPGFVELVKYIQSVDGLVYVYTASEKVWANVVVSQIEKAHGIKIERPIFTRKECIIQNKEFRKSIPYVTRLLLNSIKSKHSGYFDQPTSPKMDLKPFITLIDNTNVYSPHDQDNLVVCPTYTYRYPENLASQISFAQFKNNTNIVNEVLLKYIPGYHATSDFWTLQKRLSVFYVHSITAMKHVVKDTFWDDLMYFIKAHPKHVHAKYINRSSVSTVKKTVPHNAGN